MENATKALLISAAVLVVIVLMALGVKILGTADGTTESAEVTSNSIKDKISDVANNIKTQLKD